jgi:hypothetical protein
LASAQKKGQSMTSNFIQKRTISVKMRLFPLANIETSKQTQELNNEELETATGGSLMEKPAAIIGLSTVGGSMFGQGVGGAGGAIADLTSKHNSNQYTIKGSQYGAAAGVPLGLAVGVHEARKVGKQAAEGVAKTVSMMK